MLLANSGISNSYITDRLPPGRGAVSLSKTLHPNCLALVKPRNSSQNYRKIVVRDIKPQTNKQTDGLIYAQVCRFEYSAAF